jgi:hypothetical protein
MKLEKLKKNYGIIIEALNHCAAMNEGLAYAYKLSAGKCDQVGGEISERHPGLIAYAEILEAQAKKYRNAIEELS